MSTRACYRFIPDDGPNGWPGVVTVYKHSDGYPDGAAEWIEAALEYAWPLPRYENDEFAAAFVAANKTQIEYYQRKARQAKTKKQAKEYLNRAEEYRSGSYASLNGGGIRLVPYEGMNAHARFAGDTQYLYDIRCVSGKLVITAYTTHEENNQWWVRKFFEGSTDELKTAAVPEDHVWHDNIPDFELP